MVSNNGNLTMFSEALGTTASVEATEFPYSSQILKTWKRKNSHESNHPGVFYKWGHRKHSQNSEENTSVGVSFQ